MICAELRRPVVSADGTRIELFRGLLDALALELPGVRTSAFPRARDAPTERLTVMWHTVRAGASRR